MVRQDVRMSGLLMLLLAQLPLGSALAQTAPAPAGSTSQPIPRPDELEPGVDTTKSPPVSTPTPAAAVTSAPAAAVTAGPAPTKPAAQNSAADKAAPPKTPAKKGMDRLNLEATDVTGNSELPKVLYIVPWKRSDLGDMVGRPVNSLLDEVLQPVDRDVFRRENRYYDALKPQAAEAKPDAAQGSGVKP